MPALRSVAAPLRAWGRYAAVGALLAAAGPADVPAARQAPHDPTAARLYQQFRDPPRTGLIPYWYWNGRITREETRRQIRSMIEQGVRAAIVFPWDGMEIPYLSDAWWQALGDALEISAELGFTLNLNDDFTWPSGHAWNHYQQNAELSTVVRRHPEYRMQTLVEERIALDGLRVWRRAFPREPEAIVVARVDDDGTVAPESLKLLPSAPAVTWEVPAGRWHAFVYFRQEVTGAHNTRVDLLNPEAVRCYLDLVYRELARRFPEHLGRTLRLTTADHEGTFGVNPVWTPGWWELFRERHGYDLRSKLPLLRHGRGPAGDAVRWDYFDTVSERYRAAFVEQVTAWCAERGIDHAASFYEEQLAIQVKQAGNMYGLWRTMSAVEIDALLERARMPVDFMEAATVAHVEGRPLLVENQGLQGHGSFLSPEKMRLGSNMALLWGATALVPYFDYDQSKVQWPPQWFEGQPYWRWFRHYADYVQRVTFLNGQGTHDAPVALFYPLDSAWARARHLFDPNGSNELAWNNEMDQVQSYYSALQLELARDGWSFHILDSDYLEKAQVERGAIALGSERFRVIVLPPLTHLRTGAARRLVEFYRAGGIVMALGRLPTHTPAGDDSDAELQEAMRELFGPALDGRRSDTRSSGGGRGYFFEAPTGPHFMQVLDYMNPIEVPEAHRRAIAPVLEILGTHVRRPLDVSAGDRDGIHAWHRIVGDTVHVYWVVNDTPNPRELTIRVQAQGGVEKWDPQTGERHPLVSRQVAGGTEIALSMDAWGGTVLVVAPGIEAGEPKLWRTERTIDLPDSEWTFEPLASEIAVPYAGVLDTQAGVNAAAVESGWKDVWLAVERLANPRWWLIGPFPYGDHSGYNDVFPPELGVDLDAEYRGQGGRRVRWHYLTSPSYWVNVRDLLKIPRPAESVAYAYSDVYSPTARQGQLRIAFADSVKVWWNGERVLQVHRHPKWMLLRDPWAESAPVRIRAGWNRVLVKIARSENRPISFMFRIADRRGRTLSDLVYARDRALPDMPRGPNSERSYRVQAPPGTTAVVVPAFADLRAVFVDGRRVNARAGERLAFEPARRPVIVFTTGAGEELEEPIRFVSGRTAFGPGAWTDTTLANYSGLATYETAFQLLPLDRDRRVVLDLGRVGVAAEVSVNGQVVGQRVWQPYRFDITSAVRTGANQLRVTVANSDANWQAQGDPIYPVGSWGLRFRSERDRLEHVRENGLLGPVRIELQEPRQ